MLTVYEIAETIRDMIVCCLYCWLIYKTVNCAKQGDAALTMFQGLLLYLLSAIIIFK